MEKHVDTNLEKMPKKQKKQGTKSLRAECYGYLKKNGIKKIKMEPILKRRGAWKRTKEELDIIIERILLAVKAKADSAGRDVKHRYLVQIRNDILSRVRKLYFILKSHLN